MAFTVLMKRNAVATTVPAYTALQMGELAVNTADGILYFRKGATTVVALNPVPPTATALATPRTISLSADATGSVSFDGTANVAIATTLATVNSNIGTFNSVTVNAKGLITAASTVAYATSVIASGDASGTLSGTALALTLATVNATTGAFGTATAVPTLTVNAKGLITNVTSTAITFPVTSVFTRTGAVVLLSADVTGALGYTPVNTTLLGAASGVATLDSGSKLTASQLPASIVGAMNYQGVWNASTNTPSLVSSVGTKGFFYKVSVAGTTTLDTISSWNVGDSAVYDGTTWDKIDGITNEVISVNGSTGTIVLTTTQIAEGTNLYYTAGRASAAAPVQSVATKTGAVTLVVADVSGAAPLASPALTGSPTAPTALTADSTTAIATTAFVKAQAYITNVVASGDATGTSTGNALPLTLATVNSNVGTFGAVTLNAKGLATAGVAATYTGDATGTSSGSATALTLATLAGLVAGTYNNVTINVKGQVTASSNVGYLTANQTVTISGDATGSGTTAITLTLATQAGLTAATYAGITVNTKGLVTAAAALTTLAGYGITTDTIDGGAF